MSIDLTELEISSDALVLITAGGLLRSALNNATDRIERPGDCWGASGATPPMHLEPHGRRWSARLVRAMKEGGIIRIHQPGFDIGAPGSPTVAEDVAGGITIPLTGLTPHYVIREGQWLNYITGGVIYLDQAREQVIANADGEAEVTLQNLLLAPLEEGDVIDFNPRLEGWFEGEFSLSRSTERLTQFPFTISQKI